MEKIRIKAYYLLFIYNFFFKYYVNGACLNFQTNDNKCYDSVDECIHYGYYYYNNFELKCWKEKCPDEFYTNEKNSQGLPNEDISRNTCVRECSQNFPYTDNSGSKICKKNCEQDEAVTIDQPYKCQKESDINKNTYPYVSEKNLKLYIKYCDYDKFIYDNGEKKICVSNCLEYNLYFATGNQYCLGQCDVSVTPYYNKYKQCLELCLYNNDTSSQYSPIKSSSPQVCQSSFDGTTQCYYESNYTIYKISDHTFFKENNINICLSGCNGYLKEISGQSEKYYCSTNKCSAFQETIKISNIYYTLCVDSCSYYHIKDSVQCISECPSNYVGYIIDSLNTCIDPNCEKEQKFDENTKSCQSKSSSYRYYIYKEVGEFNKKYTFVWVSSCTSEKPFIKDENDPECVSSCPKEYIYLSGTSPNITCLKSCTTNFIKESTYSGKYDCVSSCPSDQYVLVDEIANKKNCSKTENPKFNYIRDLTNYRYTSCSSGNEFYLIEGSKIKCESNTNPCGSGKYYFEGYCLDYTGCYNKHQIYIDEEDKICSDQCKSGKPFKKKSDNVYICGTKSICNDMFIDSGNYCIDTCPKNKNFIGKDNYCKSKCNSTDGDYFYLYNSGGSYPIYKCVAKCSSISTHKYNGYNTNQCFENCPDNLKYLFEIGEQKICYDNCLNSPNNFTLGNSCVKKCNNTLKFYYENDRKCIEQCNDEDFAYSTSDSYPFECIRDCSTKNKKFCGECKYDDKNINICVTNCLGRTDKPFLDGVYCVKQCPYLKRFFISSNNVCLTDCPSDNKYYTMLNDTSIEKLYECTNKCPNGYMPIHDYDSILNARLCIKTCPDKSSKYYKNYTNYRYKYDGECYAVCPNTYPYHLDQDGAECKVDCSSTGKLYHEINNTICKAETECFYTYIDFEEKLCLSKDQKECPSNKAYITKLKDYNKIICSTGCTYTLNGVKYSLSTPYKTCVKNCNDENGMVQRTPNDFNTDCTCGNLYFINSSLQVQCYKDTTKDLCKQVDNVYRINLYNTKECITTCNGSRVLSLKEDYCYDKTYTCTNADDNNTKLITKNNNQKQCDCKYRFYYYEETIYNNKKLTLKKCLDENTKCHAENKAKYVPETMECTDECPNEFKFVFQNYFCLRNCPKDSIVEGNICKCVDPKKYWHKISSGNFECLDTCHDKYPVYAPYNNRCLLKCKDSYFPIFYEDKCYRSCNNDPFPNIVNGQEVTVNGNDLYEKTCKCKPETTWYRNESNTIICSNDQKDCKHFNNPKRTFKYLIYDTWECVDECPDEYPYIFNEGCFKNCTHAAKIYKYANFTGIFECQCSNLWYNKTNDVNLKICIDPAIKECIFYNQTLKYKINSTKECVKECPDEMFIINYTCYEKCPKYTKDNKQNKNCLCNTNMGYWYEFKDENISFDNNFLQCGVDECPYDISDKSHKGNKDTRQYLLENEYKCLNNCSDSDEYSYNFKGICINECPYLTKIIYNNCTFYDLNDPYIKNREQLKGATNIQAKELYYNQTLTSNSNKNEFFFDKYNVSILIYGIDKTNSYKDIYFNSNKYSNLTYIDFSTCLNRLFLDKQISGNEKILIAKYDIYNESNLINRVEYELFSNITNEKLDALVCDPYEILVSYPLFLERYNNFVGTDNYNEYLEKFIIGKDLYNQDNSINTFDFNSTIYKNFCIGLEYNGKDLVFEDRYKNLYPNKMLLCENNCTIKNTDFERKRINCLCTYKKEFDYNRKEVVDDIFNNPNYYIPSQSPANAEVIKCLFNFTLQQAVSKNEAFYYCFFIMAGEIALAIISSIFGISTITNFIKPILNKIQNKDFKRVNKPKKNIGFKDDNIISTTNQPLNNPPKKSNIYNNDDDEINNEDGKNNNETFENELDNNYEEKNYEINIKKGDNKISINDNYYKAEYIPQEYNIKFFKPTDKGVMKKIDRSKLPFKVAHDTKYLVEKKKGIEYNSNYLNGQYSPSQNILILTDGNNTDITSIVKYLKTEKLTDNAANNNKKDIKVGEKKVYENLNTNYNKYTDKDLIAVKKIKSNFSKTQIDDNTISDIFEEDNDDMKIDGDDAGLFTLIKREQLFLRLEYKIYLEKKHPNNLAIFIAEILDKTYIVKICLFLRKYDIFTHHLSLYLFCHVLLMSLLCGFFTIKVIKKIWDESDFPGIGFYLLYGLISHIIIWIIYQIFLYIIDFRDKIKEIILLQKELQFQGSYDDDDYIDERIEKIFDKKYNQIIRSIKCTIVVFYFIIFIIILFCTIYLISFFSLYTGTKKKVLKSYLISLIEIIIIKFIYGFSLASLRTASRINKMKKLYKIVFILDKYVS